MTPITSLREEAEERDGHLRLVWNTLMFFASESSYTMGERTGGVLQGCPRKPPPMPHELAGYARRALESVLRYLGREPEDWMLDGGSVPVDECNGAWRVIAPDGREWRSSRLLAAVSSAIEQTQLQFPKDAADPSPSHPEYRSSGERGEEDAAGVRVCEHCGAIEANGEAHGPRCPARGVALPEGGQYGE